MSGNIKVTVVPDGDAQEVKVHLVSQETADRNARDWFIFKMELLGYHLIGFIPAQNQLGNKDGPNSIL